MPLPLKSATGSQASAASASTSGTGSTDSEADSPSTKPSSPSPLISPSTSEIPLFQRVFSVSACKTLSEVVRFVTSHLDEENAEYTTFVGLPFNWGPRIFEQLDKEDGKILGRKYRITWNSFQRTLHLSMPSLLHEAVAIWYIHMTDIWFSNGNITLAEKKEITPRTNTTFTLPTSPYQQSSKVPDLAVRPNDGQSLPSFVIEVGWTEPMTALQADMELLLRGSGRKIQRGVTVKWYQQKNTKTVRGSVCLWALDDDERLTKQQEEVCTQQT